MNWETIVVALIVAAAPTLLGFAALAKVLRSDRKAAAEKSEVVEKKLDTIQEGTEANKNLLNGAYGAVLRLSMVQADRIAAMTGDPADAEAAKLARGMWEQHESSLVHAEKQIRERNGRQMADPKHTRDK